MRGQQGEGPADDRDKAFLEKPQAVISLAGGVVAILVAVLGLVFGFFPGCQPPPPEPKLKLSDVDVAREKDIAADWTYAGEPHGVVERWESSMLSIALRNPSDNKVLVTQAEFVISAVTKLGCPYGGGGSSIQARYDIKVPDGRSTPFTLRRPLKFEVPPHDNQRIGFTMGPESFVDGGLPNVYRFTLTLTADDKSRLTTDPVILMTPQGSDSVLEAAEDAMRKGPGATTPECVKKLARTAREIVEGGDLVSPELMKYSTELNRLASLPASG
ncbi:hypothetical protein [Streptomyces sp. NPDC047525]|uniref:hypothetical protein n=1 Tax=Streptomyces sp. NPDC047525 TaxID=3155264 RepID=UPI0033DE0C18